MSIPSSLPCIVQPSEIVFDLTTSIPDQITSKSLRIFNHNSFPIRYTLRSTRTESYDTHGAHMGTIKPLHSVEIPVTLKDSTIGSVQSKKKDRVDKFQVSVANFEGTMSGEETIKCIIHTQITPQPTNISTKKRPITLHDMFSYIYPSFSMLLAVIILLGITPTQQHSPIHAGMKIWAAFFLGIVTMYFQMASRR
eukprot:TRINITY_DN1360_c0_g2_i3.p1 TRINITY_DN1360_c0_g2~~TRINITY_DN1360_c0_g2_i3.p1  ORF type:complete len:195 (-),score=10.65 TRINITY_DN1360_c0_g2_i3:294-878(-)